MNKHIVFRLGFLIILVLASCKGKQEPYSFAQLCDPQLGMGGYEHDMATLRQAVKQINAMDMDFAVICGDLVKYASDSSYVDLLSLVEGFDIPYYMVPGNHDVGNVPTDTSLSFYRETIGDDYYSLRHKGTSLIFVNTQLWKADIGEETSIHDQWFEETLDKNKKKDRVIVVGHIPMFISDLNEDEVYPNLPPEIRKELLEQFMEHNVVAYLTGHKHELVINEYKGIQMVSGESTSKNFDQRPMGFRRWDVYADTVIHSFIPLEGFSDPAASQ